MTHETTLPTAGDLGELAWQDPHRPRFHFVSPGGWLNDPNGLTQWGDTYHVFYQYNPDAARHEQIHWGHAVSTDLVHWHDEPIALTPEDGPDADGCWSGVLVNDGGVPTLVYSGRRDGYERACLATGDPTLRTWRKEPGNPVIPEPPSDLDLVAYRDHCVWHEDGQWHQLMGAGITGRGGAALHYTSPDLRRWRYEGPLHSAEVDVPGSLWTGTMWECVDLFALGERHILLFSVWDNGTTHYPAYYVGDYADGKFVATSLHQLDYGLRHFYAPQTMTDSTERRVAFGWIQEGRTDGATQRAGWSGAMSLPRQLTIGSDGQVVQAPVTEVAALRRNHVTVQPQTLEPGPAIGLTGIAGDQLDIEAQLVIPDGACAEIALRCSPDGSERTVISLDRTTGELRLDRSNSSQDPDVDRAPLAGALPIPVDGRVELRVVIDHSVLEIFANGRALTARIYPTRPDATGISLRVSGGSVLLEQLDAWTMADIWTGPRPLRP
ncbi:beta-fructofuranosidase [Kribbella sp. VKM Ac-2569]|uniref:glycoside hydrolase family 32 protein n=1 Tax=Kribbella sp. VKM Ac-2569 TaxID=2512220 RepID=UPI00102CA977|nr:glycoside hydrolase family 32 protein [Kribbella sp. VKM Ac-2569]RZT27579.1 beta-fructofuranosidase [Kribbella sp. VKM Ac-2569]